MPAKRARPPRHMYAMDVDYPDRVARFLEEGGDVNDVPVFGNAQDEACYACLCPFRYTCGDYGQSVGPHDPVDFDERWCGSEEVGTAGFAGGNRTLLHWAAYFQNAETIRVLIRAGADTTATSVRGRTPYDVARYVGARLEILSMLRFDHGAPSSPDSPHRADVSSGVSSGGAGAGGGAGIGGAPSSFSSSERRAKGAAQSAGALSGMRPTSPSPSPSTGGPILAVPVAAPVAESARGSVPGGGPITPFFQSDMAR